MSEIKKGDLVIVVRHHCRPTNPVLGRVYEVMATTVDEASCDVCGECRTTTFLELKRDQWCPIEFVKKIEPLPEKEKEKTQEPIEQV